MRITIPAPAAGEFRDLPAVEAIPKVTIIVPIDHGDSRKDAILTRNLVKQATSLLEDLGTNRGAISELLDPIAGLVSTAHPLPHSIEAVAVLTAPDHRWLIPLATPAPEHLHVGDEFHVMPLVDNLDPIHCFVLTITRGGSQLWRADRWHLTRIDLPDAPAALAEVTWFRDLERQLQLHSTARGVSASFHGQGVDEEVELEPVRTYLRAIDAAVRARIGEDSVPLLLVGPGRLPSIYRSVSSLRQFLPSMEAHPDGLDEAVLGAKAAAVVLQMATERTARLLDQIGNAEAGGRSSTDPGTIAVAAGEGRVNVLLFDSNTRGAAANLAVLRTLRHGGDALPVVGVDVELAALFRY